VRSEEREEPDLTFSGLLAKLQHSFRGPEAALKYQRRFWMRCRGLPLAGCACWGCPAAHAQPESLRSLHDWPRHGRSAAWCLAGCIPPRSPPPPPFQSHHPPGSGRSPAPAPAAQPEGGRGGRSALRRGGRSPNSSRSRSSGSSRSRGRSRSRRQKRSRSRSRSKRRRGSRSSSGSRSPSNSRSRSRCVRFAVAGALGRFSRPTHHQPGNKPPPLPLTLDLSFTHAPRNPQPPHRHRRARGRRHRGRSSSSYSRSPSRRHAGGGPPFPRHPGPPGPPFRGGRGPFPPFMEGPPGMRGGGPWMGDGLPPHMGGPPGPMGPNGPPPVPRGPPCPVPPWFVEHPRLAPGVRRMLDCLYGRGFLQVRAGLVCVSVGTHVMSSCEMKQQLYGWVGLRRSAATHT
jgi:hypothetical protein